ncbi:MAG: site-2 protease family protein [Anaerolineales bacterium]|jgi:Zn-dependent protease|nr:site-2 protease family protein [Anaerolineales bacterium]
MKGSLKIGKIFGIPIYINYTWFIIFAFMAVVLSVNYFPSYVDNWIPLVYWALGICTSILFFVSLLIHELAHSFVSIKKGIPVKSITLFIFGGVAHISREAKKPSSELMMALAGPLSSVLLSGIFYGIHLLTSGVFEPVAVMAGYLAWINLFLACFNMIPGYPLDGGRVFRSLYWMLTGNYKKATRVACIAGRIISYIFITGGVFITIRYNLWTTGMSLSFVGWFLNVAASGSYRNAELRDSLGGVIASDIIIRDYLSISPALTLKQVHVYIMHTGRLFFLVTDNDSLLGSMALENFKSVPQELWETTKVGQVMTHADEMQLIHLEDDAVNILEKMDDVGASRMVVVDGDNGILGLITRDNLMRFAQVRSELGT